MSLILISVQKQDNSSRTEKKIWIKFSFNWAKLVFCKYLKTWLYDSFIWFINYEHIHCTFCYLINFYCYSWILFIYLCLLLFTRCVRNNSDMWSSSDIFSTIGCIFNQHSQSWHSSTVCCELNTRPARLVRLAFKG